MDNNSANYDDKYLHSIHVFARFACRWTSQAFNIFNSCHTTFELGKLLKNLLFLLLVPQKSLQF